MANLFLGFFQLRRCYFFQRGSLFGTWHVWLLFSAVLGFNFALLVLSFHPDNHTLDFSHRTLVLTLSMLNCLFLLLLLFFKLIFLDFQHFFNSFTTIFIFMLKNIYFFLWVGFAAADHIWYILYLPWKSINLVGYRRSKFFLDFSFELSHFLLCIFLA